MHRSKLQVLEERAFSLLTRSIMSDDQWEKDRAIFDHDQIKREIAGMANTPLGVKCTGCAEILNTEADFAGHFLIPDETYLNLGYCPNNRRNI
jgi:hypothetical protein